MSVESHVGDGDNLWLFGELAIFVRLGPGDALELAHRRQLLAEHRCQIGGMTKSIACRVLPCELSGELLMGRGKQWQAGGGEGTSCGRLWPTSQ
mgnify:CR=1 FL=1